jgi:hypothetical protein
MAREKSSVLCRETREEPEKRHSEAATTELEEEEHT